MSCQTPNVTNNIQIYPKKSLWGGNGVFKELDLFLDDVMWPSCLLRLSAKAPCVWFVCEMRAF